jgi:hypothetical protein
MIKSCASQPLVIAGFRKMDDGSKKSATRQQMLIVNDLAGNTKGNTAATCCSFFWIH